MVWIEFAAAAVLITLSGSLLAVYADRLADKTGISGAFIGLILLSMISSLPELGTTVSVVAYLGKPDLAAGNIFGSNTFNMLIVGIMDFLLLPSSIFILSRLPHQKSSLLAAAMTAVAMTSISLGGFGPAWHGIGADSALLLLAYAAGIYLLYLEEKSSPHPPCGGEKESMLLEAAAVACSGAVVVGSGYWLANIADRIAETTGWGETFVGSLFLAVTTSLPELVISITSIRLKAYDMAIANVIGSCFFNIFMFTLADPFYPAPILENVSLSNVWLALVSMLMMGVVVFSLRMGGKGTNPWWAKWALMILYLLGAWLVYTPSLNGM